MAADYDKDQVVLFKARLREIINKVPDRVKSGSVQTTRDWLEKRAAAEKMLKRPGVTATQLMGIINSLQ